MALITLSASDLSSIHFSEFTEIIRQVCAHPVDGNPYEFYFINTNLEACPLITLEKIILGFSELPVTHVSLAGTSLSRMDAFDLRHSLEAFQRTNVISLDLTGCLPLDNLEILDSFRGILPDIQTVYLEDIQGLSASHQAAIAAIFPHASIMVARPSAVGYIMPAVHVFGPSLPPPVPVALRPGIYAAAYFSVGFSFSAPVMPPMRFSASAPGYGMMSGRPPAPPYPAFGMMARPDIAPPPAFFGMRPRVPRG